MKGWQNMGMSASQARLLSITSRLTSNEFRSQTITNSKLRLAEKSSDASAEYMDALQAQKLVYGVYSDDGERKYAALTASTILSYGDLKNQYALVDTAGKVLLNGSDIKKYKESATLSEFLSKNGIGNVQNPEYVSKLTEIFGDKYENFYDSTNPHQYTRAGEEKYAYLNADILNIDPAAISEDEYDKIQKAYNAALKNAKLTAQDNVNSKGVFKNFVDILNAVPKYPKPVAEPDLLDYAKDLLQPQCWADTGIAQLRQNPSSKPNEDNIWHMEHVLAQYLWSQNSGETMTVNIDGVEETINNSGSSYWGITSGGGNGSDPMEVRDVLNKPENKDLKENLQKLYYQIAYYETRPDSAYGLTDGTITKNTTNAVTPEGIGQGYLNLINELTTAVAEDILESGSSDSRYTKVEPYSTALANFREYEYKYENFKSEFANWAETVKQVVTEFEQYIDSIPVAEIPDEKDAKYQWYVNLWYRMGSSDEKTKGNGSAYKEIDEKLINNADWLQFCLEHGMLTLEQAQFVENGSVTYPKMGTYSWVAKPYTNAPDISAQEDEVRIAVAEAKYKKTIKEIENKDKKYDQDLKKLDTEHTALQTEYESIKDVISKNVERSFKAFS